MSAHLSYRIWAKVGEQIRLTQQGNVTRSARSLPKHATHLDHAAFKRWHLRFTLDRNLNRLADHVKKIVLVCFVLSRLVWASERDDNKHQENWSTLDGPEMASAKREKNKSE